MYGGIPRPVRLLARPRRRIDSVALRTFFHAGDTFDLSIHAVAAHEKWDSVELRIAAPDRSDSLVKATFRGIDTTLRLHDVQPWTPDSPCRYRIVLVPFFRGSGGDTCTVLRGFCQLTAEKAKLYLNGNPYYLRGMGRHDELGRKGPLLGREERRKDLCDLKSLGVNFLRIAHFPQDRDIYELCDSLGLLVMDEIPAWKTDGKFLASKPGRSCGSGYMRALIRRTAITPASASGRSVTSSPPSGPRRPDYVKRGGAGSQERRPVPAGHLLQLLLRARQGISRMST